MTDTTPGDRNVVEIEGLGKKFGSIRGSVDAMRDLDLNVRDSEFLCVLGPSGCGKSTLLNILGGLEPPTSGSIKFNFAQTGKPELSIVFQEQGIFPWMNILDNAAFGLRARGIGREERYGIARKVLGELGLSDFENAYPRELSGGMRQRVNIARAFANDPQMLLMDEPFASLDEQTKLIVQDDLLQLWERNRKTVLFITHSVDEAIRLADRIVVMTARPGRIKAEFPVRIARPRALFDLQANPEFIELRTLVWDALKSEVLSLRKPKETTP